MFGIDAPELLVIALVALIFIGPKELPAMLRSIGKWMATARNMAGEFRGHVDEMMRQAELDELKKQVEAGTKDAVLDLQGLDPTREIKAAIEDGASDAQKELDAARTAIDTETAEALPPPEIAPADLMSPGEPATPLSVATDGTDAPVAPADGAPPTIAGDPADVAGATQTEEAAPATTPPAANEPGAGAPPKVAVG
ncbi:MAG: Sec-independent protein translocase protein TatB [Alphaproteobacteria bacterium]|nr:Sec-independent protein translocase protein TatB [Alphaproteobacteria bacterium]